MPIYFFLDFINTGKYEIIPAKNGIPQIWAGYTSSRFPSYFCIFFVNMEMSGINIEIRTGPDGIFSFSSLRITLAIRWINTDALYSTIQSFLRSVI